MSRPGSRRRPLPLLALLAAGVVACGGDAAAPEVLTFSATNVAVSNWTDPAGRCAPAQTLNIEGAGQSNIGAITIEQSHCFDTSGPNPLAFYDGQFINSFTDGSTFSGTYEGVSVPTANPAVFAIQGEWQVGGGTGAYAGVSGSGTASGQANVQTGTGSISLAGTITR